MVLNTPPPHTHTQFSNPRINPATCHSNGKNYITWLMAVLFCLARWASVAIRWSLELSCLENVELWRLQEPVVAIEFVFPEFLHHKHIAFVCPSHCTFSIQGKDLFHSERQASRTFLGVPFESLFTALDTLCSLVGSSLAFRFTPKNESKVPLGIFTCEHNTNVRTNEELQFRKLIVFSMFMLLKS